MARAPHVCVTGLLVLLHAARLGAQPVPQPAPAQPEPAPPTTEPALPPPPAEAAPAAAVPPPTPPTAPTVVPAADGPRTAIIDAAPIGVDAAAGRYVTNVLREAITAMGFQVIPQTELYEAARRLALPFPVPADGIFTLERALQAPLAVTAEVRAAQGQYVVHLRVRVAVEPDERTRDVTATQFQLGAAIREALAPLLVPPRLNQPTAPSLVSEDPAEATPATAGTPAAPRRPRRRPRAHPQRWEASLGVIAALGPGRNGFANALVAARVSYFPSDRLGFSFTTAYANLRGREARVSNVLFLAGIETAVDLLPERRIFIPLRAEIGYLPNNGPVFRLTASVAFSLARRVRLTIDLLSPTLWVLPETTPVTLDLGAHLAVGF
jgi:hypothetical protein